MRQGAGAFELDLADLLANEENDWTPIMWRPLGELREELAAFERRIAVVTRRLQRPPATPDAAWPRSRVSARSAPLP